MHRLLLLANATLLTASAQSLVDGAHLMEARAAFDSRPSGPALKCEFTAVPPVLNFGLRFQTGYSVEVRMNQFYGGGHGWDVLLRVTPSGQAPVFLTASETLPDVPDTKISREFTGAFVVGEGAYQVDALIKDDAGRVCKSAWRVEAKPEGFERALPPSLPPGTVAEVAAKPGAGLRAPKWGRLTVLLHAATLARSRAQLQPAEVGTLSDALGSLLEQVTARAVRVVVFSLDQRAVLYRKDDFCVTDLAAATQSLSEIQLAVVSYKTLQNSAGPVEMAADLLRDEISPPNSQQAPDAVVFLGPYAPLRARESAAPPSPAPLGTTKLFYLELRSLPVQRWKQFLLVPDEWHPHGGLRPNPNLARMPQMGPPQQPDAIAILTKAMNGETVVMHTPHEYAAALGRILGRTGGR